MTAEHKPLPVAGYKSQNDTAVAMVNDHKREEEMILRRLDTMQGNGQYQYVDVTFDQRWIAIARTHFELAYMALNRAVFQPERVKLSEDE